MNNHIIAWAGGSYPIAHIAVDNVIDDRRPRWAKINDHPVPIS